MCNIATLRILTATALMAIGLAAQSAPDWRHVGNMSIDRSLAGLATGPVDRVWYSSDGSQLSVRTSSGRVFETSDFEKWRPAAANSPAEPAARTAMASRLPEGGAHVRGRAQTSTSLYAFGKFAYRSQDGGANWENLTAFRSSSILGEDLRDLAVSPVNEEEIVVAAAAGVFRSLDGGKSWSGLNQGLPNLPVKHLLSLPSGDRGVRLELADMSVVEWAPGQKRAWSAADNAEVNFDLRWRQVLTPQRGAPVTALSFANSFTYTGTVDGRLIVSNDGTGNLLSFSVPDGGPVERFWVDPADPRVALAVLGFRPRDPSSSAPAWHVVRTLNGGGFWDDLTGNLPDAGVHGIAVDRGTGAVYIATDRGVFFNYMDLASRGVTQPWSALSGLPLAAAMDVKLDPQGHQLWVALDGFGVYATLAPHRFRDPRVVGTFDFVSRAAAPGSLVSVLGARVRSARAGELAVPVLTATDAESQIQIPFETRGSSVSLAVDGATGRIVLPSFPLQAAAPAIFVERDGSPMLLDAESGVMLDSMTPAHSRAHIQILATGLGRVKPEWPTGIAAPMENPPQVTGTVRAYLDRNPVDVTRAVLAPYVGFYMVEIEIPKIVNYGPAELYLEVDSQPSNRVRVYIEP